MMEKPLIHEKSSNGSVIKHVQTIERINVRDASREDFNAYSWPVARFIRRDLNLVMSRLFFFWKTPERRERIMEALWEVDAEARRLEENAQKYELPANDFHDTIPLRIISRQSVMLVDSLKTADRALYKLIVHHGEDAYRIDAPEFFRALGRLKGTLGLGGSDKAPPRKSFPFWKRLQKRIKAVFVRKKAKLRR